MFAGTIAGLPASVATDPMLPTLGLLAETMPEYVAGGPNPLTVNRLAGGLVWLEAGVPVTGLVFPMQDAGGPSANSRIYSTLYSVAGALLAQSVDLSHNGWPVAGGSFLAPFTAPYDPPASGPYVAAAYQSGAFGGGDPVFPAFSGGQHTNYAMAGHVSRALIYDDPAGLLAPPPAAAVWTGDDIYYRFGVY